MKGPSPRTIIQRALAMAAAVFGLATIVAGLGVLAGADPGYVVFRPLLFFNTAMGFAYAGAGYLAWRDLARGTRAAAAIVGLNAGVLGVVAYLQSTGSAVAAESVRAMAFRTAVWFVLWIGLTRVRRAVRDSVSGSAALLCLLASSCGGGFAPADLRTPRVTVPLASLRKALIHEDARLGLIQGLVQPPAADAISVFGYSGRCLLTLAGDRAVCSPVLPEALPPVSIGTFVTDHHIAADFDGDDTPERLVPLERAGFKLETAAGAEVARSALERFWAGSEFRYWFEPAVTWSQPRLVLVSVDATILVLDARLKEVRTLPVPGMNSPMHISAGAPLGGVEPGPFASVVVGRGGWHRSVLFIHSAGNAVIYQEILGDDFGAVWPLPVTNGRHRFLVGGRGQIWEYSFE